MSEGRRSSGLGWFYLGAALGAILAAGSVVVATEVHFGRSLRRQRQRNLPGHGPRLGPDEIADNIDLVEGLSHVVSEGLNVMADAVARLSDTFGSARREAIRYGLGSESAGAGHDASSHGWYLGDDDEVEHPAQYATPADLRHADDEDELDPLPG